MHSGKGCKIALNLTVYTDVVFLATVLANKLNMNASWVLFGTWKHLCQLQFMILVEALGPEHCAALPVFHAMTGCDSSFFAGRGKKTAWEVGKQKTF